ncbi:MAG: DUF2202 domain-containing protein [Bacteroidales bacterium]|nr:DUF2202 domain-containing protein [Bacteroidales bacterium]
MKSLLKIGFVAAFILAMAQLSCAIHADKSNQAVLLPDTTAGSGGKGGCSNYSVSNIPASPLSENEKQGLIFMREEEKLARDVYTAMIEFWDIPVFSNISRSETSHMEAILALLEKYQIPDPVTTDKPGVFTNPAFTSLYQTLVNQGKNNLVDALRAGALIEETDIADLRERMKASDNEDIKLVYENLLQASYRHLRAFSRNLEFREATYTPQRLSQKEIDEILNM